MFRYKISLLTPILLLALVLYSTTSQSNNTKNWPKTVAIFDFEMIDTSGGMIQEEIIAQNKRLKIITKILRQKLEESKRYKPIDISPAKKEIEYWRGGFHACNGCDADVAKKLGADLSLVGYVQKVSNLILNINVFMRDTKTGKLVEVQSVDVRGNTDETWTRSMSYMIRNRILDDKWSHMKE